jgi:putative flippase GtrA
MMGLLRQAGRFGLVGFAATLVHVMTVVALVEGGAMRAVWANLVAFSIALAVSYLGNHRWTFQSGSPHGFSFPRFAAVAVAGLLLNQAIVYAGTELLGVSYLWALAVVVLVIPTLGFAASRWWAFAAPSASLETRLR